MEPIDINKLDLRDAVLVLRDAIFFEDCIFYRKYGDSIILKEDDIKFISYYKPSFINYLLWSGYGTTPGYLWIEAKVKLEGKEKPKRKILGIKIKYEEVFKLPAKFQPIGWCD